MRRGKNLFARMREKLDIPCEALPGGFSATLCGDGELTVRGCRKILVYSEGEILLALHKARLSVQGKGLLCTAFDAGCITVTGEIFSLSIMKGGAYAT